MDKKNKVNGVSLVEILVVIGIIGLLAAIIFPIMNSAKSSALLTKEFNQLKQIYLANELYEQDHDQGALPSLMQLAPTYLPVSSLTCSSDVRHELELDEWPVNPWILVIIPGEPTISDPPFYVNQRSETLVSYFYLKAWENRVPGRKSYFELRQEPEVGLVTGVGLMKCTECHGGPNCVGACEYFNWAAKPERKGHPATNLQGKFASILMGGAIRLSERKECPDSEIGGTMSIGELFFGKVPGCGTTQVFPIDE